ncbi:aldehyde ferredoxin oxidoreductase family protein [candidate division KSB1 bacterium]
MLKYGYGGRILRIDMTGRRFRIEPLESSWIRPVIGGRAANSKRLYQELDTGCDPLGPENMLVFGIGPLTGSFLPASAFYTVSAKSPLTGILGDSAAGGQFAAEMKQTGFDQIIITGQADKLLYLMITDNGVDFIECPELAGKIVLDTTEIIRNNHNDCSIQVAAIGPAGENKVLFASIVSSGHRVNRRTGMGAVMGSKNLKAVAVRGSRSVEVADTLGFMEQVKQIEGAILQHRDYQKHYKFGTTMLMQDINDIGALPTKHFQEGVCDYLDEISGRTLAERFKVKNKACFNCNLHCSRYYVVNGLEAEGPGFESLCGFTSRIGNRDLPFALEMNRYLNQMGMDSISASEVIGWIMECQEKGLIHPGDLDGFHLKWGDTGRIREAVEMIVFRCGIGDRMADGAAKMSQDFSEEAQKLVMQVKGLDLSCGDPRGMKAYGLASAISARGAGYLSAYPFSEPTDRLEEEGKAALVSGAEKIAMLTDSITMCGIIGVSMDILDFGNAAALLKTGTGLKYTPDYLEQKLGQAVNTDRKLNRKFGVTHKDDTLPERFQKEPLTKGRSKGSTVNIYKMVDEYNMINKWQV